MSIEIIDITPVVTVVEVPFTIQTEVVAPVGVPDVTAPSASGTPQVDDTLTVDVGDYGGSAPITASAQRQVSADGSTGWADEGSAVTGIPNGGSTTYVPVVADVGEYLRWQVTPSNGAGDGTMQTTNALGPVLAVVPTLVAQRASASGFGLRYVDTLAAIPDSGSPDYAYDGTSGSTALDVEDFVAPGDVVGLQRVWDSIADAYAPGWSLDPAGGVPGSGLVVPRGAVDPRTAAAYGLTPALSSGDQTVVGPVAPSATRGTVAAYFNRGAATRAFFGPLSASGLYAFERSGDVTLRLRTTNPSNGPDAVVNDSTTPGTRMLAIFQYDNDTPGTGTGTVTLQLWVCGDGSPGSATLIGSDSKTYPVASYSWTDTSRVGMTLNGSAHYDESGLVLDVWDALLITDGDPQAVADGADADGGLSRSQSLTGYRSGVLDPSGTTRLIGTDETVGSGYVTAVS